MVQEEAGGEPGGHDDPTDGTANEEKSFLPEVLTSAIVPRQRTEGTFTLHVNVSNALVEDWEDRDPNRVLPPNACSSSRAAWIAPWLLLILGHAVQVHRMAAEWTPSSGPASLRKGWMPPLFQQIGSSGPITDEDVKDPWLDDDEEEELQCSAEVYGNSGMRWYPMWERPGDLTVAMLRSMTTSSTYRFFRSARSPTSAGAGSAIRGATGQYYVPSASAIVHVLLVRPLPALPSRCHFSITSPLLEAQRVSTPLFCHNAGLLPPDTISMIHSSVREEAATSRSDGTNESPERCAEPTSPPAAIHHVNEAIPGDDPLDTFLDFMASLTVYETIPDRSLTACVADDVPMGQACVLLLTGLTGEYEQRRDEATPPTARPSSTMTGTLVGPLRRVRVLRRSRPLGTLEAVSVNQTYCSSNNNPSDVHGEFGLLPNATGTAPRVDDLAYASLGNTNSSIPTPLLIDQTGSCSPPLEVDAPTDWLTTLDLLQYTLWCYRNPEEASQCITVEDWIASRTLKPREVPVLQLDQDTSVLQAVSLIIATAGAHSILLSSETEFNTQVEMFTELTLTQIMAYVAIHCKGPFLAPVFDLPVQDYSALSRGYVATVDADSQTLADVMDLISTCQRQILPVLKDGRYIGSFTLTSVNQLITESVNYLYTNCEYSVLGHSISLGMRAGEALELTKRYVRETKASEVRRKRQAGITVHELDDDEDEEEEVDGEIAPVYLSSDFPVSLKAILRSMLLGSESHSMVIVDPNDRSVLAVIDAYDLWKFLVQGHAPSTSVSSPLQQVQQSPVGDEEEEFGDGLIDMLDGGGGGGLEAQQHHHASLSIHYCQGCEMAAATTTPVKNGKRDEAELVENAIKEALDRTAQSHSPPTPSTSFVSQISDAVDMSNDSGRAVISELRKKITTHESSRIQWAALLLLDSIMQHTDVTFHLNVADTEFLTSLSKVLQRPDCDSEVKSTILRLASEWAVRYARDADILPNFQSFYARLQDEGFKLPGVAQATPVATATVVENGSGYQPPSQNLMDLTYEHDAEGQDPETFIPEVQQTLDLWHECFNKAKRENASDVSTNEALISLAGKKLLQLWIELLEPGDMMDTALSLNSEVLRALDDFRAFRSRAA
ncbi:hypothetical protein FOL47_004227 [Perkinsus chesapeaki]|uniref:Uncharacterized protein n=1 Tax=Perkinsus chesapeaki TaxID=330153 RepID=A0A7J6M3V8_PERCH|nr:hypothetical protein FOL47_004227 [Perkinsus chesapeaki]